MAVRLDFEFWSEFVDYAASQPSTVPHASRSSRVGNYKFTETLSFESAVKLALDGWDEGREQVKKLSGPIVEKVCNLIERQDLVYDVEGMGIDIARFVDGEPECWQRYETTVVEGESSKLIHIVFNLTVSSGIDQRVITAKGAAIAALVETLEYAGNRVKVTIAHALNHYECYVTVKSFDQPIDLGRLVFALAHPSSLRRIFFSAQECQPRENVLATKAIRGKGYAVAP